jgi:hypothetical protein
LSKSNNPMSEFWWKDWEADTSLRRCSYAAQGFWMRLLCIMAAAEKRGYLMDGKAPLTARDLAMMLPGGLTEEAVESYLSELRSAGVFSVTATGVIYNRRMVRSTRASKINAENGRKGGLVSASRKKVFQGRSAKTASQPPSQHGAPLTTTLPTTPTHTTEEPPKAGVEGVADARSERQLFANRIAAAIGVNALGELQPSLCGPLVAEVESWIAQGCDWMADVAPALATKAGGALPSTPGYWRKIAMGNRDRRMAGPIVPKGAQPAAPKPLHAMDRRKRVDAWARGHWPDAWGPRPGEAGCCLTAEDVAHIETRAA